MFFLFRVDVFLFSVFCFIVFFFQAEDGIRDLVRSRGLGDVYKRQHEGGDDRPAQRLDRRIDVTTGRPPRRLGRPARRARHRPVSYTHLTLPTSDLV